MPNMPSQKNNLGNIFKIIFENQQILNLKNTFFEKPRWFKKNVLKILVGVFDSAYSAWETALIEILLMKIVGWEGGLIWCWNFE